MEITCSGLLIRPTARYVTVFQAMMLFGAQDEKRNFRHN